MLRWGYGLPMTPGGTQVLYVLGFGRSGSTILDLLLGEVRGFFSAGELQSLWRESLLDGRRCGCGPAVAECRLWDEILGGRECAALGMSPEEVVTLQGDRLGLPPVRGSSGSHSRRRSGSDWARYGEVLQALYRRIAEVTGAEVIVDSSKLPSVAPVLEQLDGVDVSYLQLVRDPRAVAHSWRRAKEAVDRLGGGYFDRLGVARSTATWNRRQRAAERVRARAPGRSLLVRYEDFVARPAETLVQVAALAGRPEPDLGFLDGRRATLAPNHTVSGNPVRLRHGEIELREDTEWVASLPARDRAAVTSLAWPLLRRYGYPLGRPPLDREAGGAGLAAALAPKL